MALLLETRVPREIVGASMLGSPFLHYRWDMAQRLAEPQARSERGEYGKHWEGVRQLNGKALGEAVES